MIRSSLFESMLSIMLVPCRCEMRCHFPGYSYVEATFRFFCSYESPHLGEFGVPPAILGGVEVM